MVGFIWRNTPFTSDNFFPFHLLPFQFPAQSNSSITTWWTQINEDSLPQFIHSQISSAFHPPTPPHPTQPSNRSTTSTITLFFKQECADLNSKTEKLTTLVGQVARAYSNLYEHPTKWIIEETKQVLDKALSLILNCRANFLMKHVFTIIHVAAFRKTSSHLENSIAAVSILDIPIAANKPMRVLWKFMSLLLITLNVKTFLLRTIL